MYIIDLFMTLWNNLAKDNGKVSFRNQKEAADFVRQVQNELGSPNDKLRAMHKRYIEANNAHRVQSQSGASQHTSV